MSLVTRHLSLLETVPCDVCGSAGTRPFLETGDYMLKTGEPFSLVQCEECGVVRLNPRPGAESLLRYYPAELYWDGEAGRTEERREARWVPGDEYFRFLIYEYRGIMDLITAHCPGAGRMLDIGCGIGQMPELFRRWGWQAEGVETSPDAVAYAREVFHLPVQQGDFLKLDFAKESYDLVTLFGVLEHLPYPARTLAKANGLLVPGGCVAVIVPHLGSLGAMTFRSYWYGLDAPRHLYHFNRATLARVLRQSGYEPLGWSQDFLYHQAFIWKESLIYLLRSLRGLAKAEASALTKEAFPDHPHPASPPVSQRWKETAHNWLWGIMGIPAWTAARLGRGDLMAVIARKV